MAIAMPVNMYCMAIILWSVDHRYFWKKPGSWCACPCSCGWATGIDSAMGCPASPALAVRDRGHGQRRVLRHPGGVLLGRLDEDARRHQRVADAADLRALDVVLARAGRMEPAHDDAAGHGVLLEPEHRHREAVEHVLRGELEVVELVHLDVQLVHLLDVVGGIEHAVGARVGEGPRPLLGLD